MNVFNRLIDNVELELANLATGEVIFLESIVAFNAALESSLGYILPPNQVREIYKAAIKKAEFLESRHKDRNPLAHKLIKPNLEKGYYLVNSSKYALGKIRNELREQLKGYQSIEAESFVPTAKSAQQKEAELLMVNLGTVIRTGKVDPKSTDYIKRLVARYLETLSAGGGLSAKYSLNVFFHNDMPSSVINRILIREVRKMSPQIVESFKGYRLPDRIANTLAGHLDPKKKPKKQSTKKAKNIGRGKRNLKVAKDPAPTLSRASGKHLSPLALMNAINRKLPQTIRKNMGSPRLNWRTGRFANSAKVNKITASTNSTGLIQYSYMGYPYSIFEPGSGSKLASAQRDPRKVIDMSIREVARSITSAKFTTRRSFS